MIESTEYTATLAARHGSVVGVRNERLGSVLALTVGAETTRPARLNADQCRTLAAYLIRQASALDNTAKADHTPAPTTRRTPGLYDRPVPEPLRGIDSHWGPR
ncbi:hypothetical protein ACIQBJ_33160 [Kitasatospora sp. NPDC088391]|uniref:hypothetical protein n=1 Tax=Kitasatospora sp. NPDC088391 TaxID=3364074 RepID=UPI00381E4FC0